MFIAHLLRRTSRVEEDLVDQLFTSSEKRLVRLLLLLANFGKGSKPETIIAKISQETLAEMVGTTRSRVSFFMNKFRQLGLIAYNGDAEGGIEVHSSLLNVVLHDKPKLRAKCSNSSVLNAPHCPVHPNDTSWTVPNFSAVTRNNYVHSREPHPWRMCYNRWWTRACAVLDSVRTRMMPMPKTTQPTLKPDTSLDGALSRWENEGGAVSAQSMDDSTFRSGLADEEEKVLLRLGAGVVACWTDLPNEIQRELFRTATSEDCQPKLTILKRQIARFLHLHANDLKALVEAHGPTFDEDSYHRPRPEIFLPPKL